MSHSSLQDSRGFTLVELIVATSILLFGIVQLTAFFLTVVDLTTRFYYKSVAYGLGQEGMEVVKNIRDNNIISGANWSQGLSTCATGCQLDYKTGTPAQTSNNTLKPYTGVPLNISDGLYSYDAGTATPFNRMVLITQPFSYTTILKVEVVVMWTTAGKNFTYRTIGYIYSL